TPVALQEGETILAKCAGLCGHLQAREVHRHLPDSSGDRTERRAVHATPNNSPHQHEPDVTRRKHKGRTISSYVCQSLS
ncbi:hypothetical protein JOB18_044411, partial [Solea senegalensis]